MVIVNNSLLLIHNVAYMLSKTRVVEAFVVQSPFVSKRSDVFNLNLCSCTYRVVHARHMLIEVIHWYIKLFEGYHVCVDDGYANLFRIVVMVNLVNEDSTEQDIDLIGAIGDSDTVVVGNAPFLTDHSNFRIALEDVEVPAHSVTDNLIIIFSRNVDGDFLLVQCSPVLLLGDSPFFTILEPYEFFPRTQLGTISLLQASQFYPIHSSEGCLASKL